LQQTELLQLVLPRLHDNKLGLGSGVTPDHTRSPNKSQERNTHGQSAQFALPSARPAVLKAIQGHSRITFNHITKLAIDSNTIALAILKYSDILLVQHYW